jgi:LPXTG-site transpeptidase (sortase) family protein
LQTAQLLAPIPREDVMDVTPLVVDTTGEVAGFADSQSTEPVIVATELDYTNLSNWFAATTLPELASAVPGSEVPKEYTIDIPSLQIFNATVAVGGTDLNNSLIAYPGTALPGNPGSPVIFGHSVLRQFYNPNEKNPRRYNSIFSTIMTLKKGDEIFVTLDGVKYRYIVQEKTEVQPDDVYILTQRYDVRQLKLVTCTPEGTYLRRGIVTAQLIQ